MIALEAKGILSLYKNLSLLSRFHIYIRLRRLPFEVIEKYVPKKGKILDFGCGHGFFSLYMSQKSKERTVIGVDISKEKIDIASESIHSKNVSFKCSPKATYFLQKKFCYNAIVIIDVLYLIARKDQQNLLQKASEALVENGKLLIVEPDASLKLRTFFAIARESIMIKLLRLTKGRSLTFNTQKWWIKNLKKYFKKVEYAKFTTKKHHILYICSN